MGKSLILKKDTKSAKVKFEFLTLSY